MRTGIVHTSSKIIAVVYTLVEVLVLTLVYVVLIHQRETQRYNRIITSIQKVLDSNEPDQHALQGLYIALREVVSYDILSNPVLLIMEVEFNRYFWGSQIDAIAKLGLQRQKAALVELAMGLGKTSMIAPAVLSLFSDGSGLPVVRTRTVLYRYCARVACL